MESLLAIIIEVDITDKFAGKTDLRRERITAVLSEGGPVIDTRGSSVGRILPLNIIECLSAGLGGIPDGLLERILPMTNRDSNAHTPPSSPRDPPTCRKLTPPMMYVYVFVARKEELGQA